MSVNPNFVLYKNKWKEFLEGGDRSQLGVRDPLKTVIGGGGLEALAKQLAANTDDEDNIAEEDNDYHLLLFGQAIAGLQLPPPDLVKIEILVITCYKGSRDAYYQGLKLSRAVVKDDEEQSGSHGGKIPSKAEAAAIAEKKGMSWMEVVVVSSVLFAGSIPTEGEIKREGYGSDPAQWVSTKERRKAKKLSFTDYLLAKDAAGYRSMVAKGATRMAASQWKTGAAFVMLFVNKLSAMTFDQGMPELFLEYAEEHLESYKGEGLCSFESPLDQTILTETVLARKSNAQESGTRINRVLEAVEASDLKLETKLKSRLGEVTHLSRKLEALEKELATARLSTAPNGGPPGPDNVCSWCKGEDHFIRDCPKKKLAADKKAAQRAADEDH